MVNIWLDSPLSPLSKVLWVRLDWSERWGANRSPKCGDGAEIGRQLPVRCCQVANLIESAGKRDTREDLITSCFSNWTEKKHRCQLWAAIMESNACHVRAAMRVTHKKRKMEKSPSICAKWATLKWNVHGPCPFVLFHFVQCHIGWVLFVLSLCIWDIYPMEKSRNGNASKSPDMCHGRDNRIFSFFFFFAPFGLRTKGQFDIFLFSCRIGPTKLSSNVFFQSKFL